MASSKGSGLIVATTMALAQRFARGGGKSGVDPRSRDHVGELIQADLVDMRGDDLPGVVEGSGTCDRLLKIGCVRHPAVIGDHLKRRFVDGVARWRGCSLGRCHLVGVVICWNAAIGSVICPI